MTAGWAALGRARTPTGFKVALAVVNTNSTLNTAHNTHSHGGEHKQHTTHYTTHTHTTRAALRL